MENTVFEETQKLLGNSQDIEINKIDTIQNGYGNFYLQPNGILYLTKDNKGVVCSTKDFINENINYATQSGPMLVVKGKIHSMFNKGSKNTSCGHRRR